ncbi:M6 family metalloprotease domain-containing protein [bacterium]|nr:M6 family metalloprotease domain-containing protein [bacterium]
MIRSTILIALFVLLLSVVANATVRPPDEWFDSPDKLKLWEEMYPVLNDWEFGPQPPLGGAALERFDGIRKYLGYDRDGIATAEGLQSGSAETQRFDLNLDGVIDHFDLLELGYEVAADNKGASIAPPEGTNQWMVLRADFQDQSADYGTYDVDYFNERFFSLGTAPKPSINDYYQETSYGKLAINGTVDTSGTGGDGWYKGEHDKQWYIDNGGRWLVKEAVLNADPFVDFSDFDVDGDGYVDTVLCYYPNTVFSGGLWPHRSSGLNIHVDGVIVDSYFISGYNTGNDSHTMVIAAHEYGHILGLPDLYDVNGGSAGMGFWSLMAYNYDNGQKPPSLDPWCKCQLGWVEAKNITENQVGYSLPYYQDNPEVLRVWTNGQSEDQYFLMANYRKLGTDANRPGEGLLLLHIDETRAGGNGDNANEDRKHVDVESARGYENPNLTNPKDPLDNGNNGHANDLFFDGNSDGDYTGIFDDTSNPFSRNYPNPGANTFISLSNISAPGNNMTLDITVETATAPTVAITSHSDGDSVSGTINVTATASATTGRSIDHVDFYLNGAFYGADSTDPYELAIDTRGVYDGNAAGNNARLLKAVAVDDQGEIDTDGKLLDLSNTPESFPLTEDFESGVGAWASYNLNGDRFWQAKNTGSSGSWSAGIGSEGSGYDYNEHDALVSPRIDLSSSTHPLARWQHRHNVSAGENTCKVFVTADEGVTLTPLASYTGSALSWHPGAVDLLPWAGQQIRIVLKFDGSGLNKQNGTAGWWVDELELKELSAAPNIITITPGDGSTLTGIETITVDATDDEAVLQVDFLINGTDLIFQDFSAPFTTDWNSDWLFNGAQSFTAVAYDGDLQSTSVTVNWTTSNAGLPLPWNESFTSNPVPAWRVIDVNGEGYWHRVGTGGYGSGPGMFFGKDSGDHGDNQYDWFISPTFDFQGIVDPGLGYLHHYDIELNYDYGRCYVTTDLNTWSELHVFTGLNQNAWREAGARLDGYLGQKVKLAWFFEADGGVDEQGWFVDEPQLISAGQISSVTPASVVNGDSITISGSGFGSNPPEDFGKVLVSGIQAAITSWNDTEIVCTVPAASASGNVIVRRRGIDSDGYSITIKLPPPSLTGLEQR